MEKEKNKAEKEKQKERERKERAKQKEKEEKQLKANLTSEAVRIVGKLSPLIAGLQEAFTHPKAHMLPEKVCGKGRILLDSILEMEKACKAITDHGSTTPLPFTMEDVHEQHKEGTRWEQLFNHRRASPFSSRGPRTSVAQPPASGTPTA